MMTQEICNSAKKCGSCQYQGIPYEQQLQKKQKQADSLLRPFGKVLPIIGMENPLYYRNKVHAVFGRDKKGNIISGTYEANSHRIVPIEECRIEDRDCQAVIRTIRGLLRSFKIRTYDEDTEYGLLRHVLVRKGFATGEIMVVLVLADPVFPSKNNFVKALRAAHPEITTIVLNINDRRTSMVLGDRNKTIYGPGFIRDRLCGLTYRISPPSFYQVNPVQTERIYRTALSMAGLSGKERVVDAYCGIGTIGMSAAELAKEVIGVELNPEAVRDAKQNARDNGIKNIRFFAGDAGEFLSSMAASGEQADVVFMDPPRTGSDERFLSALEDSGTKKIVYISCEPETMARDLKSLGKKGYRALSIQPFDQFPFTDKLEAVAELVRA